MVAGNREANWVDDTILRYADSMSFQEISDKLGNIVSAESVASYLQRLLKQKDTLTEAQEMQLNELRLKRVLAELDEQYLTVDNAKLRLTYLKEILSRLDKRIERRDDKIKEIERWQGEIMARAYDIALTYIAGAISMDVEPKRWDEIKQEALGHAKRVLDESTAIEA